MTTLGLLVALFTGALAAPTPPPTPAPAASAPAPATADPASRPGWAGSVGLAVGPLLPLNGASPFVLPRLEAGIAPPLAGHPLLIELTGAWTRPSVEVAGSDARVSGGAWSARAELAEWQLGAGASWRFMADRRLRPEVGLGGYAAFVHTTATGKAEAAFPTTDEREVVPGFRASGGVSYAVGPIDLTGRLDLTVAPLHGVITGKASTLAITPLLGARWVFGG